MNNSKNQKDLKEREIKDIVPCMNNENCKVIWYRYKNKDDNFLCKACAKIEKLKELEKLGVKKNSNYQKLFNCNGTC